MSHLLDLTQHFLKLANPEEEPKTERTPRFRDERLQAYELMSLLNSLAVLKNQLHKIKDLHSLYNMTFNVLVRLRPGIIKNAIQGMIEGGEFDVEAYNDLKSAVLKDIESSNLTDALSELVQVFEVELLYDEELTKSPTGHAIKKADEAAKMAIKAISEGLRYL